MHAWRRSIHINIVMMYKAYTSKFIFFGVFTVLCSGFPFSSFLAAPGVCSRSFEGLFKQSNGDIHLILVAAVFLIGVYLLFSGVGLINLSGCLLRLGMPSDYPNAVTRAFMYSQFRADSKFSRSELGESNIYFGVNSRYDNKNSIRNNLKHCTNGHCNTHILTLDGEQKKKFKLAMRTTKARLILAAVSIVVIICISYTSYIVLEGSQIFLNDKGFDLLGYNPGLGDALLLLFITLFSTVILNVYTGGVFFLCIVSWINFFGLLLFSIISVYSAHFANNKDIYFGEIESVQFDWDVHIWGFVGEILDIGTFVISTMAFHIILPGAFKIFSDGKIKSSSIWGITILLILFIFLCVTSVVLGITPSFQILPHGFEPSSEGIGIAWKILESRVNSRGLYAVNLARYLFLLGNFFTIILFISIAAKCVDNIVRCISNQIECNFDSFSSTKNSSNKRYFLRSAKQQIFGSEEAHFKGSKYDDLTTSQIEGSKTPFHDLVEGLRTLHSGDWLLDLVRSILNSVSAIGILLVIHYVSISEPQFIPIFRSVSISIFSIIVLILPCAVFWSVFYSEMVPQSASNLQKLNLIFFGRISRYDRNCDQHRDKLAIDNERHNFSCNPLIFGFFSITLPITLGCTILVYECSKIASLFLGLRFNAII